VDVEVGEPAIYDPVEGVCCQPGDLLLAVACEPGHRTTLGVIESAGRGGARAVVLRGAVPDDGPEVDAATAAGVALLTVRAEMSWGQLHTFLRTACSASGSPQPSSAGAVPLGDLFALANAVAAMVGGPTTIEDVASAVLAYSAHDDPVDEPRRLTILGRRVPDEWLTRLETDGVFRRLWTDPGVIRVDYEAEFGLRPRLAVAVRAGGETLGSIWVAQGDSPLGEAAEAALAEAAQIAALHLIRHRAGDDLERRRRSEVLRALLDGAQPTGDVTAALGIGAHGPKAVLAIALLTGDGADLAVQAERAVNLVTLYCEAYRRQAVVAAAGRIVHVVLPLTVDATIPAVTRLATDIVERTETSLRVPVHVGIGPIVDRIGDLAASRVEADQVLRILAERGGAELGPVASTDDVRSELVLLRLRDLAAADSRIRAGKVAALVEHDRQHGSAYVETLRAYLDAFGDVRLAAESVAVHPNTFRYRIRRLGEVSGLRLEDPTERLVAELQLRLLLDDA
jgi:sugar diacid utilization regulator